MAQLPDMEKTMPSVALQERVDEEVAGEGEDFNAKRLTLLSVGHLFDDCYPGFLGPLLPLLIPKLGISIALAGFLATLQTVSSSLTQPVYGYLADRIPSRLFVVLGVGFSALFFSLIGVAPHYVILVALVVLGGAGVAAFHPSAAVMVSQSSRRRRTFGMSVFISAGNLGFAVGPLLITFAVAAVGLGMSFITIIPGVVMAVLLYRFAPKKKLAPLRPPPAGEGPSTGRGYVLPLVALVAIVVLQSSASTTFSIFVPTYLQSKGFDFVTAGAAVSVFLFGGSAGVLASGYLADAVGRRRIIALSLLGAAPLLYLFLNTNGFLSLVLLGIAGFLLQAPSPLTTVMGQELVPRSANTTSGLVMGFAWGLGAISLTAVGIAADRVGLPSALAVIAVLPILGALLAATLPKRARPGAPAVRGGS